MWAKSISVVALASMIFIGTTPTDHAFAALNGVSRNPTPQGVSTGEWAAVAGPLYSSTTRSALALRSFSAVSGCNASSNFIGTAANNSTLVTIANVAGLSVGMTYASGQSRIQTGSWIKSITGNVIELSLPTTGSFTSAGNIKFAGCHQKFFYVNNIGSMDLQSIQIAQTVVGSISMSIQKCSLTGGFTSSGTCPSGIVTEIFRGSGPSTFAVSLLGQSAGVTDSYRFRALSTSTSTNSTTQTTISISVSTSDLRAATNTNA